MLSVLDYGADPTGAVDSAAAFAALSVILKANAAANPNMWQVVEFTSGGKYKCSDYYPFVGVPNLIVEGNGSEFLSTGASGSYSLQIGGSCYQSVTIPAVPANATASALINTAHPGDASVTTVTHSDAGNFTVGQKVLICSMVAYPGGSPPGMRFLEYATVTSANASTGVIGLDGKLTNYYSATLPSQFMSGLFDCRARIFPATAIFGAAQIWRNLVIPAPLSGADHGILIQGWDIECENLTATYIAPSQIRKGALRRCVCTGSGGIGMEWDKLIQHLVVDDLDCAALVTGGRVGGQVTMRNSTVRGDLLAPMNFRMEASAIGGTLNLTGCNNAVFQNNDPVGIFAPTSFPVSAITVDGATITWDAANSRIVIPYTAVNGGGSIFAVVNFLAYIWEGCVIDLLQNANTLTWMGDGAVVESITDDVTNIYLNVSVESGSISNGAVFAAPGLTSYQAAGNLDPLRALSGNIASIAGAIPNGDVSMIRGNRRAFLFAPTAGGNINLTTQTCRGRLREITVNVLRAYTGAQSALYLRVFGNAPAFGGLNMVINLKTAGKRRITDFSTFGALTGDTLTATNIALGNFAIFWATTPSSGAAGPLADTVGQMPIVEVAFVLEDIQHGLLEYQ